MDIEELIRKHALKNAHDYGRANPGAVAGKVIAEFPNAKNNIKEVMQKINKAITEINKMKKQEIEKELARYSFEKKEEEKKTITLPDAEEGKVITRFPPEPNGYLHIGHAKAIFLDYEAARAYRGKMLLRFDDTNPKKEKQEYVDAIKENLRWLGVEWGRETYTSDYMPRLYEYAEKLISIEKAYVCLCEQSEIKENRKKKRGCVHRKQSAQKNLELWKEMLAGEFEEGTAVLRYNGDMKSENTALRDPALFRIVKGEHYRQKNKYLVWPSYDFEAPVLDSMEGITHAMRSKEYELREALYYSILNDLRLRKPVLIHFARLSIKNAPISKRLLAPLVLEGKVTGWDDPRLPTIVGLKRRGILPEAIRNFVLRFGIGKTESEPGWEILLAENRKLLDPSAKRFFFVKNPVLLEVENTKPGRVLLKDHPGSEEKTRAFDITREFYISESDAKNLKKGEKIRLKDLFNIEIVEKSKEKIPSCESSMACAQLCTIKAKTVETKEMPPLKIHWLPKDEILPCRVLVPHDLFNEDGKYNKNSLVTDEGFCEKNVEKLNAGDIIQFERYGFCRLDKKGKEMEFIYSC
ncbi:MAG: glutamate--tRNA ligase [Candidatus Micrarchaeia archaeon]